MFAHVAPSVVFYFSCLAVLLGGASLVASRFVKDELIGLKVVSGLLGAILLVGGVIRVVTSTSLRVPAQSIALALNEPYQRVYTNNQQAPKNFVVVPPPDSIQYLDLRPQVTTVTIQLRTNELALSQAAYRIRWHINPAADPLFLSVVFEKGVQGFSTDFLERHTSGMMQDMATHYSWPEVSTNPQGTLIQPVKEFVSLYHLAIFDTAIIDSFTLEKVELLSPTPKERNENLHAMDIVTAGKAKAVPIIADAVAITPSMLDEMAKIR